MKISRTDNLYIEIDKIENHSVQYQVFISLMKIRYYLSYDPKENVDKYIEHSKIKSKDILELSNDRDFFEMQCKASDEPPFNKNRTEYFIKDYTYYNNANYQVWVNIDFSLPKEMLIAQISQLKDDIDRDEEMQAFFKSQKKLYEDKKEFIHGAPSSFAKSIKRQYGDFLFVIDCKKLGYKIKILYIQSMSRDKAKIQYHKILLENIYNLKKKLICFSNYKNNLVLFQSL